MSVRSLCRFEEHTERLTDVLYHRTWVSNSAAEYEQLSLQTCSVFSSHHLIVPILDLNQPTRKIQQLLAPAFGSYNFRLHHH
jgi:hypothetical protein